MTVLEVVVPEGIHDPARPSGGNTYDRLVCRELRDRGWVVHEHAVPGHWPRPDSGALAALHDVIERLRDGAVVLLDGLIASAAPEVLVPEAGRLRLVVLLHMSLGDRAAGEAAETIRMRERAALAAAAAVVTTSEWSRNRMLDLYELPAEQLHVAEPGVAEAGVGAVRVWSAELEAGAEAGEAMLCVGLCDP